MDGHQLWVFAHIMLLVYWLGADVGVLVLARMSLNAGLSVETRATLLKGAMLIDVLPRLCFPLMLPVGLMLIASLGLIGLPAWLIPAAWVYALAWCGLTLASAGWEGKPAAQVWRMANLSKQGLFGAVFIGLALWSLAGDGPGMPDWLAIKLLIFGLIYPAAIMIDVAFGPGVAAYAAIASEGSTPDREAAYRRAIDHTCVWVVIVYALVALVAFYGTVKPA
jgi:hypothetical protein